MCGLRNGMKMKKSLVIAAILATAACSGDENNGTNNGSAGTNNGSAGTNNGTATGSNNGTTGSNNGMTTANNGTTGSNNGTTGSNNGTTGGTNNGTTGTQNVEILFGAAVNGADFACGTRYDGVGSSNSQVTVNDFRFYVSNVRMVTADGTESPVTLTNDGAFQSDTVALLDFEDGSGDCADTGNSALNDAVIGTVAEGEYTQVAFTIGVPFDENHQDATLAETPLNLSSMFWVWQGGYKFIRIDMGLANDGGFNVHLGSTMCMSADPTAPPTEECGRPNRMDIVLDYDSSMQKIVADIGAVVADSDLTLNTEMTPPGCHSFPTDSVDCGAVFPNLGLDFETGECTNGCGDQAFFSVVAQ